MTDNRALAMIAAVGPDLELGRGGDLIWHISADLKNFKRLTTGHPVIMGRKTWESLPRKPLPGRKNIVLSRSMWDLDGALCVQTPEEALEACRGEAVPYVIGGEQIYRAFMPMATELFLTHVDADPGPGVDCSMPEYRDDWELRDASEWMDDGDGIKYRFEKWLRKN